MTLKAINSHKIEGCTGVQRVNQERGGEKIQPAGDTPADAIVTVFEDGTTRVSCHRIVRQGFCSSSELGERGAFCAFVENTPPDR